MNTAFTKLSNSSHKINNSDSHTGQSKIKVNVVGDWSKKRYPSVSFGVKQTENKKQKTDELLRPRKLTSFNMYLTEEDNVKSVNEYNDDLPDKVEGTYKYDFNILDIHNLILKRFEKAKHHEIHKLEKELAIELDKTKQKQNMVERKTSLRKISQIQNKIDSIKSGSDFENYINQIKPLIEQYNIIGTLSKIVSFATNKKKEEAEDTEELPEDTETQHKRHQIIFDFLEVARKYIEVDLVRDIKEGNLCPSCGYRLDNVEDDNEDTGVVICPNCGLEKLSVVRCRFYKDNTRTNNSGNNYEDRANFEKVVMRYQGKQHDKPPSDLYIVLNNYFNEKELINIEIDGKYVSVNSEYIKTNVLLDENGEKPGTTRALMYKALKDTGNSSYYDHINLILHEMWGWELPDISHLEDQIMDDYDKSQRIYEALPKDRKSSLNSQFRLFKHLRRLGFPCKTRDFRIPATHDILEFHLNMWAKICEILGWENL